MRHKWIWTNVTAAAVLVTLLLVLATLGLNLITRHGKTVRTPDFTNLTVSQAKELARQGKVHVKVTDSVFVRRLPGGVVYRQLPLAGSKVKEGRSIFLTINSVVPRKVVMPNLLGYSFTESRAELKNRGLNLGRLNYVRDIATNTVLGQSCEGREVKAGDLVVSGSLIDLKVGVSSEDNTTVVPKLIGMKFTGAVDALHEKFLNVGRLRFDDNVRTYADSTNAFVYKQDAAAGASKNFGAAVNLYLTLDKAKLPEE